MKQLNFKAAALSAVAIAALAAPVTAPVSASAQVVVCSNCSNIGTQLAQQALQVQQQLDQALQLKAQLDSYANMITNTDGLEQHVFGDALNTVRQINQIIKTSQGIAYSMDNLDQQFDQKFKSLDDYKLGGMSSAGATTKYAQWGKDTSDSVRSVMRAAGVQASGMDADAALMETLQNQSRTAKGQMQAISVGNEMSSVAIGQLQQLRQLQLSQIQLMAADIQTRQDKETVGLAAAIERGAVSPDVNSTDGKVW